MSVTGLRDGDGRDGAGRPPQVPGVRLVRLLGAGGQADVWLADDLASGEQVAVKVGRGRAASVPVPPAPGIPLVPVPRADGPGGSGEPGGEGGPVPAGAPGDAVGTGPLDALGARRLAREIALLRRIDHQHVVRLRRVVDLPGGARALVLDHAPGGSLEAVVRGRGPLPAPQACTVVVPLARTLAELHERGLVHGDLTPSNVLFTADGRPLIADLGCALIMGEDVGGRWGSDGYVDPASTARPVPADDVYALGAVLRFALTGDPAPGTAASYPSPGATPAGAGDARREALLALADLCTCSDPGRRPELRSVARTAMEATAAEPVRLLAAQAREGGAVADPPARPPGPSTAEVDDRHLAAAPDRGSLPGADRDAAAAAGAGPPTRGAVGAVCASGRPIVVRIAAPVRPAGSGPGRPPRSAAEAGWTRSADPGPEGPTVAHGLPLTRGDLPAAGTPARRPVTGPDPFPPRRRDVRERARAVPVRSRSRASWAVVAVAILCLVGWWRWHPSASGRGPATPGVATAAGPSQPRSSAAGSAGAATRARTTARQSGAGGADIADGAGGVGGAGVGDIRDLRRLASIPEALAATVLRLAEGRAEAFRRVSAVPLRSVDEPGSPAFDADRALVERLRTAGVRLDGLSFAVTDVRAAAGAAGAGGVLTVTASVTTSAHRLVALDGSRVTGSVPAGTARRVTLALVPSADGTRWLVRQTWGRG